MRLQRHEALGLGVRTGGRGVFGAFAADGAFARTSDGDLETEQAPFFAVRFLERAQVAVVVPFVQTRRTVPGLSGWGGGLGDARVSAHVELTRAGARAYVPGIALLLGASIPTGTAPDEARDALAADATGTGAFEGSAGVEVEQRFERTFVTFAGSFAQRAPRVALGVREGFGPELSALVSGGAVFAGERVLGIFLSGSRAGPARETDTGAEIPGSARGVVTMGLGGQSPVADLWRIAGTASVDGPLDGLGRNQSAGVGLSVSVVRVWP
jgi:hypothetical protein